MYLKNTGFNFSINYLLGFDISDKCQVGLEDILARHSRDNC